MKWITADKYVQESGLSSSKLRTYIKEKFENGKHYFAEGRTTWINVQEVDNLLDTLASENLTGAVRSVTPIRTENGSKSSPTISTLRLE